MIVLVALGIISVLKTKKNISKYTFWSIIIIFSIIEVLLLYTYIFILSFGNNS